MSEIRFDVISAEQAANRLAEVRRRFETETVSGFETCRSRMSGSWEGSAADRFYAAADRELDRLHRTAKLLERTQTCILEAIRTAQRTEEKTKEIAVTRRY